VSDWREQYKPGDWVEMRTIYLSGGENEWARGKVIRVDEDRHGQLVMVDVDGLAITARASENIRTAKPPRPAKKRLRVKAGA
jgi:hypothetical protein